VDQGGCIETSHPTTHSRPTYAVHGVIHYAVPNMPGIVPRTATYALSNATLPYVQQLANKGLARALRDVPCLARGVNTHQGHVTHKAVAETFNVPYVPVGDLMS